MSMLREVPWKKVTASRAELKRTRVQLFLPIADLPVNIFLILAMGAAVGFVSGMFGIGGGFLMTPLLIFIGIAPRSRRRLRDQPYGGNRHFPAHCPIGAGAPSIRHWRSSFFRRRDRNGAGRWLFTLLRRVGQLDLIIALSYVVLLTIVGSLMFLEGARAIVRAPGGYVAPAKRPRAQGWILGMPMKMRFKRSKPICPSFPSSARVS